MRLATLEGSGRDGQLVKVSPDGRQCSDASPVSATLREALEHWEAVAPRLAELPDASVPLDPRRLCAPLPRTWQWLDGSAYRSHSDLMDQLFGAKGDANGRPLMYQGLSDRFYGPSEDVRLPEEELGIDFEGEFGVIVDAVPMGITPAAAMRHIRLIVQINDWSLRTLAGPEMKTGFGWVQAKPACSMAPFAVTPDELGPQWRDGRVCLDLEVQWNGERFGNANGAPMQFGFHELVAHAARTRELVAGTVIGSGTVSNANFRQVGSSCIAERRAIEMIDHGEARTPFLKFGDRVRMEAHRTDGTAPFGAIDQRVVPVRIA
jgi:fumarylacetoacetate (FAA) hydrolase